MRRKPQAAVQAAAVPSPGVRPLVPLPESAEALVRSRGAVAPATRQAAVLEQPQLGAVEQAETPPLAAAGVAEVPPLGAAALRVAPSAHPGRHRQAPAEWVQREAAQSTSGCSTA